MTMLKSRLARLEQGAAPDKDDPFGLDDLTFEQLRILDFDLAWLALGDEETRDDRRAGAARRIAQAEREIREAAANWAKYPAHRELVQQMWEGRRRRDVSAEMAWRRETRARADIAALIAEGEAQGARQETITARPGITAAVVPVAPPPVEVPPIGGCSAAEPFAPAPIPIAYPTATEAPARGFFVADYDPYREFRPR